MRELSKNSPAVLIVAVSGRSLASAACRAGYRTLVADLFGDSDTVALAARTTRLNGSVSAGIDEGRLVDSLSELARGEEPVALVYGSGFERRPGAIGALARHFPLAGNGEETVRAVKDPARLARICGDLGIVHPKISFVPPDDGERWLTKLGGGAGGSHVRPSNGASAGDGRYYQQFAPGRSVSALFLALRDRAHVIGFSRQWSSPSPASPFRYGGAVRLMRFERDKKTRIAAWLDGLTRLTGLVGLCSADFVDGPGPDGLKLIEINPRPGATLDIFDSDEAPLLAEHLRAVNGQRIAVPAFRGVTASAIAYTRQPIARFPPIDWPAMTADHQNAGSTLDAGDPVCTVFARASSAAAAERAVKRHVAAMAEHWKESFQ